MQTGQSHMKKQLHDTEPAAIPNSNGNINQIILDFFLSLQRFEDIAQLIALLMDLMRNLERPPPPMLMYAHYKSGQVKSYCFQFLMILINY